MSTANAMAESRFRRRRSEVRRRALRALLVEVLYWTLYGACRVYLFWWVLGVYGVQRRRLGLAGVQGGVSKGCLEEQEAEGLDLGFELGERPPGYRLVGSVFWHLRWPCQVGTGILGAVNAWWFARGVGRMLVREWRRSLSERGRKMSY